MRGDNIKKISFIVFIAIWYIVSGILFSEKQNVVDWLAGLIVCLIGIQWVYAYIFSKSMFSTYAALEMKVNSEKDKNPRLFHFIIGVIIFFIGSFMGTIEW
jgi:hypothetical protein